MLKWRDGSAIKTLVAFSEDWCSVPSIYISSQLPITTVHRDLRSSSDLRGYYKSTDTQF